MIRSKTMWMISRCACAANDDFTAGMMFFMFSGTFFGNLSGFLYFIIYLTAGIFISQKLFDAFRPFVRLWLGTTLGTVMLMWLPAVCSIVLGFNILSHITALVLLGILIVASYISKRKNGRSRKNQQRFTSYKNDLLALLFIIPMCVFYTIVETNHILAPAPDGGLIFGQSTYFDANIHLSFITTPVAQGKMPFVYNILPTMQVSYPFLSDTVSASVYVFGSSLRLAYILPTLAGAFNVFTGAYVFFEKWLKKFSRAIIAWLLFFFNGGFGFIYFLDGLKNSSDNFTRIFTALYETPTNLNSSMIRWVNTFCDMMIPQRATLFGWMMLFAVLYLLYRAVFMKEKKYFIHAGIFAGLTPLISTHIFLSIAVISAVWMISRLAASVRLKHTGVIAWVVFALTAGAMIITYLVKKDLDISGRNALIAGLTAMTAIYIFLIIYALKKGLFLQILSTWGVYLITVLVLALPQLICFTFRQSSGSGFLRPHFNWINYQDEYIWFYIKNVGICALLLIPAVFNAGKRQRSIIAPIAVLMLIAETFAFQPNTYDNNKLLYPAYVLVCGAVAEYMCIIYSKIKTVKGSKIIAALVLTLCMLSAVLSMGREAVAGEYEIFSSEQVELAWWIQNNTDGDDVFLTNDRYNNTITGMSGRNVVCGSNSFFSTHGLPDFYKLQNDVSAIYSDVEANQALIEKYNVDYIVVGREEEATYDVNEEMIAAKYDAVYNANGIRVYKVK